MKRSSKAKESDRRASKKSEVTSEAPPESDESKSAAEKAQSKTSDETLKQAVNSLASEIAEKLEVPDPPEPQVYEDPPLLQIIVENYEGEKVKGFYEGHGKLTFRNGKSYEGEFNAGNMSGTGRFTWPDGTVYEGEFQSSKITGYGKYMWPDGSFYEGQVENGIRHGQGTLKSADGSLSYSGMWDHGKKHGTGQMNFNPDGSRFYRGDWVSDIQHGWGICAYPSGNIYEGMWYKGKRHGEGTMQWFDRGQMYAGQWEMGVQHGMGQHVWFVRRSQGSQFPLRNVYDGEFNRGIREGSGTFYYANGSVYIGEWLNNLKHGQGKFIFKNGRVYEGEFHRDKIKEYPGFDVDGELAPESSGIRTRTPLPAENMSLVSCESRNTFGPTFRLEVGSVLGRDSPSLDQEEQILQVMAVINRHSSVLKQAYDFYSSLGYVQSPTAPVTPTNEITAPPPPVPETVAPDAPADRPEVDSPPLDKKTPRVGLSPDPPADTTPTPPLDAFVSPDNTYIMSRLQYWRFMKDCRLDSHQVSLTEIDRFLRPWANANEEQSPMDQILIRDFINNLIRIAYLLYNKHPQRDQRKEDLLSWCFTKLVRDNLLPNSCNVKGNVFWEKRRIENVMSYFSEMHRVYCAFLVSPSSSGSIKDEKSMTMRQFLFMVKDLGLINKDLTAGKVIEILAADNSRVMDEDGTINLEIEMTFLEFLEAIVGCATEYMTDRALKEIHDETTGQPKAPEAVGEGEVQAGAGEGAQMEQDGLQTATVSPTLPDQTDSQRAAEVEEESKRGGTKSTLDSTHQSPATTRKGSVASGVSGKEKVPREKKKGGKRKTSETPDKDKEKEKDKQSLLPNIEEKLEDARANAEKRLADPGAAETGAHLTAQKETTAAAASTVNAGKDMSKGDAEARKTNPAEARTPGFGEDQKTPAENVPTTPLDPEERKAREFNLWTHQLHSFLINRFLLAAHRYVMLKESVATKVATGKQNRSLYADAEKRLAEQEEADQNGGAGDEAEMGDENLADDVDMTGLDSADQDQMPGGVLAGPATAMTGGPPRLSSSKKGPKGSGTGPGADEVSSKTGKTLKKAPQSGRSGRTSSAAAKRK